MNKRAPDPDLSDALTASAGEITGWHKRYGNPGQVAIMSSINFNRRFVRAEGCSLFDDQGNEYLDFLGGYGSVNVGHNHPKIISAILEVLSGPPKIMQASLSPFSGALMAKLAHHAPGDLQHTFLCNSGAEAVEAAVKMARAATGRSAIVAAELGFHGKTMGALSVSGKEAYQKPFLPILPGCRLVPYNDVAALRTALRSEKVAAFFVEPIQGEAGVIVPSEDYLAEAADLCRKHGVLLVVDEIQTGLGRTGTMFACEQAGVSPDVMLLAKSLSGAMVPIGAAIATRAVWNRAFGGMNRALLHSSTFGGNTLACVAALAALEVITEEKLAENAASTGRRLLEGALRLKERHRMIQDVRGRGLLIGVEFRPVPGKALRRRAEEYAATMATLVAGELLNKHHIVTAFTLNNPNIIRLEPPLSVSEAQVDALLTALDDVCGRYGSWGKAIAGTVSRKPSLNRT